MADVLRLSQPQSGAVYDYSEEAAPRADELLKNSELGRRVMGGAMPETVEEFRTQVPLTTYADYLPDLVEKRDEGLPAKPAMWVHTVGRIGEYNFKWVPLSERFESTLRHSKGSR